MRRKYFIAYNERERRNNFKYIYKEYDKKSKKEKISIKEYLIDYLLILCFKKSCYSFDKHLCRLYTNEIKLYYLNNRHAKDDLRIRKAYLDEKNMRRTGIVLPIFISLIASIIYGICSNIFDVLFRNEDINVTLFFFDMVIKKITEVVYIINSSFTVAQIIYLYFLIIIIILGTVWVLLQVVFLASDLLGGINFSKRTANQYEVDFLEEVLSNNDYFKAVDILETYEMQLFHVLNTLIYNIVVNQGEVTVVNIINELSTKLLKNSFIDYERKEFEAYDDELIAQSIVCRVVTKINEKSPNLMLRGDVVSLK